MAGKSVELLVAVALAAFLFHCRNVKEGRPDAYVHADVLADAGADAAGDGGERDADAATASEDAQVDAGLGDPLIGPDGGDAVHVNTPPAASVTTPAEPLSGMAALQYTLFDAEGDRLRVKAEFSLDRGLTFAAATRGSQSEPLTGLSSSPSGVQHRFIWDSVSDVGKRRVQGVVFRITPSDARGEGEPGRTEPFEVFNRLRFSLAPSSAFPAQAQGSTSVAAGDVDADGDVDVVIGQRGQTRLYMNNGQGVFVDVTGLNLPRLDDQTESVALVDIEGDLDLDLVLGNSNTQSRILINDGFGTFADETSQRLPARSDQVETVLLGDVNGDGKPDLFLLCSGSQQNRLYLNDGAGFFGDVTAERLPVDSTMTASGALADMDGRNGPDLLFANFITSQGVRLWLNDGEGNFTDVTDERLPRFEEGIPMDVAAADVDGDYDLDHVEVNILGPNRVIRNTGGGSFEYFGSANPDGQNTTGNAGLLADFDLDGVKDFFLVTSTTSPQTNPDLLFLNNGRGRFTLADESVFSDQQGRDGRHAAAADIDADGDLDIIVANDSGGSVLWINE